MTGGDIIIISGLGVFSMVFVMGVGCMIAHAAAEKSWSDFVPHTWREFLVPRCPFCWPTRVITAVGLLVLVLR